MAVSEWAIRTDGLTRDFGAKRALDGLTIDVPRGTIFGFLGPNGSGKTTTIRLLLGLLEPDAGSAEVLGFDTRRAAGEICARCGALLEFSGLYERLSAWDNLQFCGRVWRMPAAARDARARTLLERVGLWERRADPAGDFSRGMKQKLAVARALLHGPELVFLDEPAAGLDPLAASDLNAELTELVAREGVTVFLTTHDLSQAEKLCQQVAIIRDGWLVAAGPPNELRARAGGERAEIVARGVDDQLLAQLRALPGVAAVERQAGQLSVAFRGAAEVAPLVGLIVANGGAVEEVRKGVNSLEDVFLEVVKEGH